MKIAPLRIAVVAESFLPHMNGVTHSLLRMLDYLAAHGHRAQIIAPEPSEADRPQSYAGAPIRWLPSVSLPGYPSVRLAIGGVARVRRELAEIWPDVVHLASPFVLGWRTAQAAEQLALPTVASYQTDVPAYAARYGLPGIESALWQRVSDIHERADLTLAPSEYARHQLIAHGIPRVKRWTRGVDADRFTPARRDPEWRAGLGVGPDEVLIGYIGRLAAEKQVDDLAVLAGLPGTRLVIIGSGPYKERLQKALPQAIFTGFLGGDDLARAAAGLDLFVHPGESETFCQTIQEAMASGVPVVAVGRGGPLDLVDQSRNGWLYPPGDLATLRAQVADLAGDHRKRRAFAEAARRSVEHKTWDRVCDQLLDHYRDVLTARRETPAVAGRSRLRRRGVAFARYKTS